MAGRARHEWREWSKAVLAWSISCLLLLGGIALVGEAERTQALQAWIWQLTVVLAIWLIWPVWDTIASLRPAQGDTVNHHASPPPRRPKDQRDGVCP